MKMTYFFSAVMMAGSLWFVFVALGILERYENTIFLSEKQKLLLADVIVFSLCLLSESGTDCFYADVCSVMVLLVAAVVDGVTGYVHDFWSGSVWLLLGWGMLRGSTDWQKTEVLIVSACLIFVALAAWCKGMGEGDVPVYLALLLYYICYAKTPAWAGGCMLLLSQALLGVNLLINGEKTMPLLPSVWMAHLITVCWFG